jgi:tRNA-specific 2-thiouridylase
MSGGVDSSVTALLLKKRGYNVIGIFMRSYNIDGCAERDAEDARRVAEKIGIPFYVWDFENEYKKRVVQYMVDGYRMGITPNPDVMCNKEIKFGLFLQKALSLGADYVATGHYVRIKKNTQGTYALYEGKDAKKDQSYFLWTLTQKELAHCLFPIGELVKPEVRKIAKSAGLSTAEKKDSQGICFLGQVTLVDFLKAYIPETPGPIVDEKGRKLGEHDGISFYTIGQRHGLDLKEKNKAVHAKDKHATLPHYVARKDVATNTLVVAEGEESDELYAKEVSFMGANIISSAKKNIGDSTQILVRIRYRQPLSEGTLFYDAKKMSGKIIFRKPQKFVAKGQSVVFYAKTGEMFGGGVIA